MPMPYSSGDVSAFVKESDGEKALVVVNVRNRNVTFELPAPLANSSWYRGFDRSEQKLGCSLQLGP
jgi:hypothetical protein